MNRKPLLVTGLVVIVVMLLVAGSAWLKLPDGSEVPIHFDAAGQANGFAGKGWGLLLTPLIATGLLVLLYFIPLAEPRAANLARSSTAYNAVCIAVMVLMGVVQVVTVGAALGWSINTASVVFCAVGVLFVVIGVLLPRLHSNFIFGIRTPWTLTSERSWKISHRVGGWAFGLGGVIMVVGALVLPPAAIGWMLILVVTAVALVPSVVSYFVWRGDPDRSSTTKATPAG